MGLLKFALQGVAGLIYSIASKNSCCCLAPQQATHRDLLHVNAFSTFPRRTSSIHFFGKG
jgi:hypothetical protein